MTDRKVLIIEDNPLNLELVTDLLEVNGLTVLAAPTAEDGLRIARESAPSLILMDFNLPGLDGLSATRQLKADSATRHLKVVGLTAHAMKGDEEKAREAGCDGYLTKPIDPTKFVATISSLMTPNGAPLSVTPAPRVEVPSSESCAAQPEISDPLGFVLVVDDEEQNRSLLRDSLEPRGYEVDEAENGQAALKKISERLPDVVLLDLMMPGMNGFEVCRRIRECAETSHLPVLMVTALSERSEKMMGIEAGANDFLNKPVDMPELILRVRNAVRLKHLTDKLQAEQEKSERLLLNILPEPVAERMKKGETNIADSHMDVTVLISTLIGFNSLSAHIEAGQVVHLLNEFFSAFDGLVEKHRLEKIKTTGDAYIAASGLSDPWGNDITAIAELAFSMQDELERVNLMYGTSMRLRISISTGPVVAGVIGQNKFAYDIWGETVNRAWLLDSNAEAGRIQVDEASCARLKNHYRCTEKHSPGDPMHSDLYAYWLETQS